MGTAQDNISVDNLEQGAAIPDRSEIVRGCRSRAADYARRVCEQLFEALGKDLEDRAAGILATPGSDGLGEALHLVQNGKAEMAEVFRTRFAHHFQQALRSDAPAGHALAKEGAGSGFSLVENSELEESLAVDRLVGKVHERCSEDLFGLAHRLAEVFPGTRITQTRLPLGPEVFCQAFRDALASLELETGARLHCCKLLDGVLMQGIGEFYSGMNKYLSGMGVLPRLKAKIGSHAPAANHAGPARDYSAVHQERGRQSPVSDNPQGDGFLGETVAAVQEHRFQAMQYLLSAHGSPRADAPALDGLPADRACLPATPMLVDTLSSLQRDPTLAELSGELIRGGLKRHVIGRFTTLDPQGRPNVINQIDDETIDVISMIFDYILDDATLPDFIKALIGRLQIPVLKVAIVDREFFTDKLHPARQLLNELACEGMNWNEEYDAAKDRLYDKMQSTVRRILDEFDDSVAIFATVLDDFREFLAGEKRNFALVQAKIGTEIQEADHVEGIKTGVAEEIARRLLKRDVPEEIRVFLTTTWRQLVTSITLEEGRDGIARTRALQVMDDLLWSLEPKTTPEQRRRLGVLLPILLDELREGLTRLGQSNSEIKAFIAVLERYHFSSLKVGRTRDGKKGGAPAPSARQPDDLGEAGSGEVDRMFQELSGDIENLPEIDMKGMSGFDDFTEGRDVEQNSCFESMMAEMGFEAESDTGPRIDDEYTALVRSLELGAWIELTGADGGKMRTKLAWAGDAYTNFSFVNRQYKVVAERPLYVLADEFRNDKARVIENVALFDRALDGVVSGIMKLARAKPQARHA